MVGQQVGKTSLLIGRLTGIRKAFRFKKWFFSASTKKQSSTVGNEQSEKSMHRKNNPWIDSHRAHPTFRQSLFTVTPHSATDKCRASPWVSPTTWNADRRYMRMLGPCPLFEICSEENRCPTSDKKSGQKTRNIISKNWTSADPSWEKARQTLDKLNHGKVWSWTTWNQFVLCHWKHLTDEWRRDINKNQCDIVTK